MHIYKLKYQDKTKATQDFVKKGIYLETSEGIQWSDFILAIVDIGLIVDIDGTYDSNDNIITPPTFIPGYHYDIMSTLEIDFGDNEIFPNNPKHGFL